MGREMKRPRRRRLCDQGGMRHYSAPSKPTDLRLYSDRPGRAKALEAFEAGCHGLAGNSGRSRVAIALETNQVIIPGIPRNKGIVLRDSFASGRTTKRLD